MYRLTEYVESIEEINEGKLFTIKDFSFESATYKGSGLKIPQSEYEMFDFNISSIDPSKCIFSQVKFDPPFVITGGYSNKEYSYKKNVSEAEAFRFKIPIFNSKTTYALFNKCNKAYLYYDSSKRDLRRMEEFYWAKGYNFYPGLMACKRAIDIYKDLIDEILPLFEEPAREQVKAVIYRDSIKIFIDHACDYMEYIQKDIKNHLNEYANYTTHSAAIDSWENAINMVSALLIEVYTYVEIADRYSYKEGLEKHMAGVQHYERVYDSLNPDNPAYIKEHIELYKTKIKPVKYELENFYKLKPKGRLIINVEENATNSVVALRNNTETFVAKPPKAIVWAVNSFQSAQSYVSALYGSVSSVSDEKAPLLEELKNYNPVYQTPKKAPIDKSIDQNIVLREKNLFLKSDSISVTDVSSLSEFIKECCDTLNLIRMRYSLSLSTNNNAYFSMFETAAEYDQRAYSLIIESYIENIIGKCLTATINCLIENKNNALMLDLDLQNSNIDKLIKMIKSVQVYLYNAEKFPRSTDLLEDLINAVKNIPNAEQIYVLDVKQEHPISLRKRYVRVSPI